MVLLHLDVIVVLSDANLVCHRAMQAYAHWLHVATNQKFWKEKVNAPVQIEAGVQVMP